MIRCPVCRSLFPRGGDIRVRHPNTILFTCPICFEERTHRMTVIPTCGHAICNRCFTAYMVRITVVTVIDVDDSDVNGDSDGDVDDKEDQEWEPDDDN